MKYVNPYFMIQTPKVLNHCFDTTTPKVKWLFEQVQTPFRLLAFVSFYTVQPGSRTLHPDYGQKDIIILWNSFDLAHLS